MGDIVIFGAAGRAGRAITTEALRRGHRVTAVVRDPGKYPGLGGDGVRVVRGDITDARSVSAISQGHVAAVHAVSPASGPEALAKMDLDENFFVKAADALLKGLPQANVPRLLLIGLFANLQDDTGHMLMDDPAALPAQFRPFALAHTAGLEHLRTTNTKVDWLMLTPPAQLDPAGPRTGAYRVGGDTVPPGGSHHLSYADLAVAAIDEIETPRHHNTRIAVFG